LKSIKVKKGQILQGTGEFNSKIYAVESGLLRSYIIDENGKEHILMFAPENWIIADLCSPDESTQLFIDAIEASEVNIHEKDPDITIANKFMLKNRLKALQDRTILLLSASAIERYEHFTATYPNILQRVPQKMIASYLGITPEALSKVKGDRIKEKNNSR